jgi:hypothetical protein
MSASPFPFGLTGGGSNQILGPADHVVQRHGVAVRYTLQFDGDHFLGLAGEGQRRDARRALRGAGCPVGAVAQIEVGEVDLIDPALKSVMVTVPAFVRISKMSLA